MSLGCLFETELALPEGIMEKSEAPFQPTETPVYAKGVFVIQYEFC